MAVSILEKFYNNGSLIMATTHYPEIKQYALVNKGFKNASCEFDIENLKPTYKLLLGIPGKSNAFAICKKIGFEDSILNRATEFLSDDSIHIEDLLKNIHDEKLIIEKEKEEIEKNLNQVTLLRKNLERDNTELDNKSKKLIEDAKEEARNILLAAKDNATRIIREMKSNSNNVKQLENLRNSLNNSIKEIAFVTESADSSNTKPEDIKVGMNVYVISLNQNGTVLSTPNKDNIIQVQVGPMKINADISDITILVKQETKKEIATKKAKNDFKSKNVSTEINVIGLTVDEAVPLVDKYLDDVYLSSIKSVRIVHGKGTGKLREGIHKFLRKEPHVKSFRLGTFGEGEMGVTIVELKK